MICFKLCSSCFFVQLNWNYNQCTQTKWFVSCNWWKVIHKISGKNREKIGHEIDGPYCCEAKEAFTGWKKRGDLSRLTMWSILTMKNVFRLGNSKTGNILFWLHLTIIVAEPLNMGARTNESCTMKSISRWDAAELPDSTLFSYLDDHSLYSLLNEDTFSIHGSVDTYDTGVIAHCLLWKYFTIFHQSFMKIRYTWHDFITWQLN